MKGPSVGQRAARRFMRRRKAWKSSPEYQASRTLEEATALPAFRLVEQANELLLRLPARAWQR